MVVPLKDVVRIEKNLKKLRFSNKAINKVLQTLYFLDSKGVELHLKFFGKTDYKDALYRRTISPGHTEIIKDKNKFILIEWDSGIKDMRKVIIKYGRIPRNSNKRTSRSKRKRKK